MRINLNTCKFCNCELNDSNTILGGELICTDCGVNPTPTIEPPKMEEPSEEIDPALIEIFRCMRELQFIRAQQYKAGETDEVLMSRKLVEIFVMMENELDKGKSLVTKLNTRDQLKARFFLLNAIVYGLTYLSNHPSL